MSTILKALQKIESESNKRDPGAEKTPPQPPDQPAKGSITKRPRQRWRGIYLAVPILVLLAVVGLWRYRMPSSAPLKKQAVKTYPIPKQPAPQPVSKKILAKKTTPPLKNETQVRPPAGKDSRKGTNQQEKNVAPISTENKKEQPDRARLKPRNEVAAHVATQTDTKRRRQPKSITKIVPPKRSPDVAQPIKEKIEPWRNAKPLENNRMVLQALAWAPQPEKRMGVIDGQVVREGDDVNEFIVVKIEKQKVILERNGQYFRLDFKR